MSIKLLFHTVPAPLFLREWALWGMPNKDLARLCPWEKAGVWQLQPRPVLPSQMVMSPSLQTCRASVPLVKGNGLDQPRSTPHMMMRGSGTDSPIDLWGSTLAPLR